MLGYVACLGRGVPGHLRRHVVGYLALAVAMTGGAYAAITIPANSVGTAQLRDGSVTLPKIAKAARLSLLGPVGPAGPAGPRGPIGRPGRFTGHFASRNGLFKADVSDTGIKFTGPSGGITLEPTKLKLSSPSLTLNGIGTLTVTAPLVTLNGQCRRVARVGDTVTGAAGAGTIATGSATVLGC